MPSAADASRPRAHATPLRIAFHAMALESAPLRLDAAGRCAGFAVRTLAPERVGAQHGPALVRVRTGVGLAAARRCMARLPALPIEAAVLGGFAGALVPELAPGTLVVADVVIDAASGAALALPLAGALEATARRAGLTVARGTLVTIDAVVKSAAAKRVLQQESGAIAVDMESAALAAALAARGVPAGIARVVLDAADELVPGAESLRAVGPWRLLADGVRIARRLRPCARISARFLEAWLHDARGDTP